MALWKVDEAEDTLEELEEELIMADFGPKTSLKVVDTVRAEVARGNVKTGAQMRAVLKQAIVGVLQERGGDAGLNLQAEAPTVLLVVGVNGGGKTTTIGKLANKFTGEGASVLLAAGDTFRAAAAEQLGVWAERTGATMAPYQEGKRPSGVLFDAVKQAITDDGGFDVCICDTSGRLHTNSQLMDELAKCKRAIGKSLDGAPHEVLLVLDGTTGVNMLNQAKEFNDTVGVTGIILTKLDGSARGGAVVSVVDSLGIPVKFVGVGETLADLQSFDPLGFVDALFPEDDGDEGGEA